MAALTVTTKSDQIRSDLFCGLRNLFKGSRGKKKSFSPELKMAEYKITEIVSIDLC